jgi:hypothetical protein
MKNFYLRYILILSVGICGLGFLTMPAFAQEAEKINELQHVINAQQKQLEYQQKQLDEQRLMMQKLQAQIETLATNTDKKAHNTTADKNTSALAPVDKLVTSGGGERIKLAISGQVNRAVNMVDDGKSTKAYYVDNDNSESRVRFVGTAGATNDLTIGSQIELSIAPNKAGEVNQNNEENNNIFDQRQTEVYFDSKRFGKLSIGKGHTASYTTATVDLSRTGVISYATIADTAGGMLFRQTSDDSLTNVRIVDAFNSFDGLNRRDRVRYDTPAFYGFRLATSAISDQRYDAALRWGGQGYGFKAAGAAGFAYPNQDDADFQYDGSFSLLHEDTGLNLTLSAGWLERDNQGDAQNLYGKLGWLTRFFSFGETAFGVDYTRSLNLPTGRDEGYSVGAAAVQSFEEYGTEFYLLYRLHSLDRDVAPSVQDISAVSIGSRVRF